MTIEESCAELGQLFPHLAAALTRDTTLASGAHAVIPASVVNPDVLNAIITLHREIPQAAARAGAATGEPWSTRDVQVCVRALPRLGQRLTALSQPGEARALEDAVRWWVRLTKRALGLRKPDTELRSEQRPSGYRCPAGDGHDGPPPVLVASGGEGFLRHTRHGWQIEWVQTSAVYCPGCGRVWGPGEWLHLGLVLREQDSASHVATMGA